MARLKEAAEGYVGLVLVVFETFTPRWDAPLWFLVSYVPVWLLGVVLTAIVGIPIAVWWIFTEKS